MLVIRIFGLLSKPVVVQRSEGCVPTLSEHRRRRNSYLSKDSSGSCREKSHKFVAHKKASIVRQLFSFNDVTHCERFLCESFEGVTQRLTLYQATQINYEKFSRSSCKLRLQFAFLEIILNRSEICIINIHHHVKIETF